MHAINRLHTDIQSYSMLYYYCLLLCISKIEGEIDQAEKQFVVFLNELLELLRANKFHL